MRGEPDDFWGKLERDDAGRVLAWNPVEAHCADVAACCEALLRDTMFGRRMARLAGRETLQTLVAEIDEPLAVAARALSAARHGALVLVLRNTVSGAVATQRALESIATEPDRPLLFEIDGQPTLHHARFVDPDRRVPLRLAVVESDSLLAALRDAPLPSRRGRAGEARCLVRVPRGTPLPEGIAFAERAVTEERDWPNQIHVGRSIVLEGFLDCGAAMRPSQPRAT